MAVFQVQFALLLLVAQVTALRLRARALGPLHAERDAAVTACPLVAQVAALRFPTARVGAPWAGVVQHVTQSFITVDYAPFALSAVFPSKAFAAAPAFPMEEAASTSVTLTLLLDDLSKTVGSIGRIGAEVGVTLQYLYPSTGKVKVIALGSRAALDIFVRRARQRWLQDGSSDGLRVRWAASSGKA